MQFGPFRFAYYDEPTWILLAVIATELLAVIILLIVLATQ